MLASVLESPWLGEVEVPCRWEPDLFFAEAPAEVEAAKAICRDCPVREQCLADALERSEPWGVWGGELLVSGEIVTQKRSRGRPRKYPRPAEQAA